MYKCLFIFLLSTVALHGQSLNNKESRQLMNALRNKVDTKHLVTFDFETLFTHKADQRHDKTKGTLEIQNGMYKMITDNLTIYFDGTAKWTVNAQSKEVVVEGVLSAFQDILTNPYLVIKNYEENFNYAIDNSLLTVEDKKNKNTMLVLYPKDLSMPFTMVKIKINTQTAEPLQLLYFSKDGTEVTVNIKKFKEARSVDRHRFIFVIPDDYVEIDLR